MPLLNRFMNNVMDRQVDYYYTGRLIVIGQTKVPVHIISCFISAVRTEVVVVEMPEMFIFTSPM